MRCFTTDLLARKLHNACTASTATPAGCGSSTAPFPMDRYLDHRVGSSRAYQRRMHQGGVDEWSVVKVNKFGWSQKRVIMIDFDARVLR